MHTRNIVIVALTGFAALALPARADTTIKSEDASIELTVPNGWRQTKAVSPAVQLQATDGRAIILIRVVPKEDYRDLKSFADVGSTKVLKSLTDAEPKFEDIQVNGNPAIRVSAEGTQSNGLRRGFIMTFIDTNGMFVDVIGIANASAFKTEQQTMMDMAGRVKVVAAGGTAPTAQTPTAPAAATPPPGRQPPPARQPR